MVDDQDLDGTGLFDKFKSCLLFEGLGEGWAGGFRWGSGRVAEEFEVEVVSPGESGLVEDGSAVEASHEGCEGG